MSVLLLLVILLLILSPGPILSLVSWTQASFGLSTINYSLILDVLECFVWIPVQALKVFANCESRAREYSADQEAVRQGLGQQLIDMLKDAERDALMNVNPHPVVEFLEYDHPGLARRIAAIKAGMHDA